jgi:multidrug efflux pump subunit AcrA (membrane-fusion protein)
MAIAKKKKMRWIVGIVVMLVVAGVVVYFSVAMNAAPSYPMVETMTLAKQDLQNLVSVTGNVESTTTKKIFSKLAYPVEELLVEVGDRVSEGDILCRLDTTDLENAITKSQATVYKSQTSANRQLTDAQKALQDAQELLEKDLNTQLLNAEAAVRAAEEALRQAEVDKKKKSIALQNARDTLNADQEQGYTEEDDARNRRAVDSAKMDLESAEVNIENKELDLEDANIKLQAVQESIRQEMEKYESNIAAARNGTDFTDQYLSIEELQSDLADCEIAAPVGGVVTAVYVTEGATPSGLMFVIEDTDSLKVLTRVMEYDIANVKLGNPVEIKSDATGETVYRGSLSVIAPTSVKNAQGDSDTAADTEFEAEVSVSGKTQLKIGMKTRMNIIYEQKKNVFAVPYDAITENENGEQIVYVARTDETGAMVATPIVVTVGMETDFDTEIKSSELAEGDVIITTIDGLTPGMLVTIKPENADTAAATGPFGLPSGMFIG